MSDPVSETAPAVTVGSTDPTDIAQRLAAADARATAAQQESRDSLAAMAQKIEQLMRELDAAKGKIPPPSKSEMEELRELAAKNPGTVIYKGIGWNADQIRTPADALRVGNSRLAAHIDRWAGAGYPRDQQDP